MNPVPDTLSRSRNPHIDNHNRCGRCAVVMDAWHLFIECSRYYDTLRQACLQRHGVRGSGATLAHSLSMGCNSSPTWRRLQA
jgi:hypothetical protein